MLQILTVLGACLIIGIAVFLLISGILFFMDAKPMPARERLLKFKKKPTIIAQNVYDEWFQLILQRLEPAIMALATRDQKNVSAIKKMMMDADLPHDDRALRTFFLKQMTLMLILVVAVPVIAMAVGMFFPLPVPLVFWLVLGALLGMVIPKMQIREKVKERRENIRHKLPEVLDLLVVCLEAGMGLDSAIARIAEEATTICPPLAKELQRLSKETNAGIPRSEAFHNLGERCGVDELKSLCALIVQTDKLGTSMGRTLRVYASDLRIRRKQRAESLAYSASAKMTIPLVLCILPGLLIVLLGPAIIQIYQNMLSKM